MVRTSNKRVAIVMSSVCASLAYLRGPEVPCLHDILQDYQATNRYGKFSLVHGRARVGVQRGVVVSDVIW